MIEIGSFIGLAAMTQSEITIKNCRIDMLGIIPDIFKRLGIKIEFRGDDIYIPSQERYEIETFIDGSILTVSDAPWPGFTPDLISIVLVIATQAKGTVLIHQKMFESRLFFVDKLIDMGAQIILCDPHRATVIGLDRKQQLKGIKMSSPDIRAGVALLIAAFPPMEPAKFQTSTRSTAAIRILTARLRELGADIRAGWLNSDEHADHALVGVPACQTCSRHHRKCQTNKFSVKPQRITNNGGSEQCSCINKLPTLIERHPARLFSHNVYLHPHRTMIRSQILIIDHRIFYLIDQVFCN